MTDSGEMTGVPLREIVARLERAYPPASAESWDAVGLVCGDPGDPVRRVLFAVDPTLAVVEEAITFGADLLVTHHPLLLRGVHTVAADTAKGAVLHRLIRSGVALYCAHTNADSARGGVNDALAAGLGLLDPQPLVPAADPSTAAVGLGRVGDLAETISLRAFAERVAALLPPTEGGVRFAGPPDAPVRRVAVLGGAGDSLFDVVTASSADVYVTADLRHHPALEAREAAAVRAVSSGEPDAPARPYLVDVSHWASESLWLRDAARALAAGSPQQLEVVVSAVRTDPWDGRVG